MSRIEIFHLTINPNAVFSLLRLNRIVIFSLTINPVVFSLFDMSRIEISHLYNKPNSCIFTSHAKPNSNFQFYDNLKSCIFTFRYETNRNFPPLRKLADNGLNYAHINLLTMFPFLSFHFVNKNNTKDYIK